jgi:CubicO group peptidase (beta-lactamase class C family)
MSGWDAVRALLAEGAADGTFPGAVAVVGAGDRVLLEATAGITRLVPARGSAVTPATWFDLASLSKPIATTTIALALATLGRLDLDAPVARYRPSFAHREVTVQQLLAHASGLAAWLPLHERLRGLPDARRAAADMVDAMPLEAAPGTRAVYSDLGFITLGALLEQVGGARLDALFERYVRGPFGLAETGFAPLGEGAPWPPGAPVAATEDSSWRGGVLEGQVHDDTAWAMGGVAGHAGLFATGRDVHRFCARWLALHDGAPGPIPRRLVEESFRRQGVPVTTRTLGWDTPTEGASSAGTRFALDSIGHLGYSGTSMWIDPGRRLVAVLLTNRVHPTRENRRIQAFRPRFHDLVAAAFDEAAR